MALARATVVQPKVLLLDEPLGALDLKLREQMQGELTEIRRDLGITFIFVTHDQEEALTLSDRIAVFNEGKIVQLGTPAEIYERPHNAFVADFVGTSNVFTPEEATTILGSTGAFSVRPEKMTVSSSAAAAGRSSVQGTIVDVIYVGSASRIVLDLESGKRINVIEQNDSSRSTPDRRGERVTVSWNASDVVQLSS